MGPEGEDRGGASSALLGESFAGMPQFLTHSFQFSVFSFQRLIWTPRLRERKATLSEPASQSATAARGVAAQMGVYHFDESGSMPDALEQVRAGAHRLFRSLAGSPLRPVEGVRGIADSVLPLAVHWNANTRRPAAAAMIQLLATNHRRRASGSMDPDHTFDAPA